MNEIEESNDRFLKELHEVFKELDELTKRLKDQTNKVAKLVLTV